MTIHDMVERQLKQRGIRDERVLAAMEHVPRHIFVPEELRDLAYSDGPLPIGFDQTISQPYIVALMTELLDPQPADKVLEVGTGCGYQTAVLAELSRHVYSIENVEPLYLAAQERLKAQGYCDRIHLQQGDGWMGWPEEAPFDRILVTAAAGCIPEALIRQLTQGGRVVIPVGRDIQNLVVGEMIEGKLRTQSTISVRFVPLVRDRKHRKEERKGRTL